MVRILIVSTYYKKESPGGAAQSIINIFNTFKEDNKIKIKFFDFCFRSYIKFDFLKCFIKNWKFK